MLIISKSLLLIIYYWLFMYVTYCTVCYLLIYTYGSVTLECDRINGWNRVLPCILLKPRIHYRVHMDPPLVPILNQKNPIHAFPSYSPRCILISCHIRMGLPSGILLSDFLFKMLYAFLLFQMRVTCSTRLVFPGLFRRFVIFMKNSCLFTPLKFKSLQVRDSSQVKKIDLHRTWNWKIFAEHLKQVWIQAICVASKWLSGSQFRNGSGRPLLCLPRDRLPLGFQNTDNRLWSVSYMICGQYLSQTASNLQCLAPSDDHVLRSEDTYEILGCVSVVMLKTIIKKWLVKSETEGVG